MASEPTAMMPDEIARAFLERRDPYWTALGPSILVDLMEALRAAEARGYERAREQAAAIALGEAPKEDRFSVFETNARNIAARIGAMQPEDKL